MLGIARRVTLDGLEMRETILVAPTAAAHLCPAVKVGRVAAHEQHAVDGGGATKHPATRPMDRSIARAFLRLGLVVPVDEGILQEFQHARGNVNHRMKIARPGLEEDDLGTRLGQSVRQNATRRACPHDNVVRLHPSLLPLQAAAQDSDQSPLGNGGLRAEAGAVAATIERWGTLRKRGSTTLAGKVSITQLPATRPRGLRATFCLPTRPIAPHIVRYDQRDTSALISTSCNRSQL